MCLLLCRCLANFVPVALWYNLKWGIAIIQALFFLHAKAWAVIELCVSIWMSRLFFLFSMFFNWLFIYIKNVIEILIGFTLTLQIPFSNVANFTKLVVPNPWAWKVFSSSTAFFNLFFENFKHFIVEDSHLFFDFIFEAIVRTIVFLLPFLLCPLLLHRKSIDF